MNEERSSLKLLISQNLISTCCNNFDYKQELKVEALIAITVDNKEIILINVNDSINFNTSKNSLYPETSYFNTPSDICKPLTNEVCTKDNYLTHENNDDRFREDNGTKELENSINQEDFCVSEKLFVHKTSDSNIDFDSNALVNSYNLKVIQPLDSYHDDLTYENSSDNSEMIVKNNTTPKNFDNCRINTSENENSFPKISLKSFSPNCVQNQVQVYINKNIVLNANKRKFSNQTYQNDEKKIVLYSNIKSAKLVHKPAIQQSEHDNTEAEVPTTDTSQPSLSGTNKMINSTAGDKNTVSISNAVTKKEGMAWEDFQTMLLKSLRRNHQEELDVKPQLMRYIQSWSDTSNENTHIRLRECMQAILLYEGRYVPVRDIQRLRLSGMTSQEIRSSMEFLNSIQEGRIGCYREIRGCIGVFYKCPPHLIDLEWLSLFGLSQHIYLLKFNAHMPPNATNRHSTVYWDRIHFSSPYITSTHSFAS